MDIKSDIPFVPSSTDRLNTMMELSGVKPGQKTLDLGSGDGRVVIAMAKAGAEAHGFEVDPKLIEEARRNIAEEGLEGKAFIHSKNFWDGDLGEYDVVTVYGITSIMGRLEAKLKNELRPNAKVVSNYFTFPNWEPEEVKEKVYLYKK
ncbi:MAG: SAM-dependent methyltransferase [Patescibacteria group bacterium]|jgi:cyclopropane fatty-acyl-phospholipid synthase-like methyltransferase